ncbi:MAG: DUF2200 domain-containing protein [Streptococcaceae bacterium]|jgi:hypothetical protein|nr:DUF2200 domain-containing protein [Streptococcaceae bacterium]
MYIQKSEHKGRTAEEVDTVMIWLTDYYKHSLREQIEKKMDIETFFDEALQIYRDADKIIGKVCGVGGDNRRIDYTEYVQT